MEAPVIPTWLSEQLLSRWGSNLFFSWERFGDHAVINPIAGYAMQRRIDKGFVEYKYFGTPLDKALDWFTPDEGCAPTHRYVARDRFHIPDDSRFKGAKIFDCVEESGAPVPPSQMWVEALTDRYAKWDQFMTEGEAYISAHEERDEHGNVTGYLNRDQLIHRQQSEEAMTDGLTAAHRQMAGYTQVGASGNAKSGLIVKPTDKEVGIVNAPAEVARELHGPGAVKI